MRAATLVWTVAAMSALLPGTASAADPVQVDVEFGTAARQFGYKDSVFGTLRRYSLDTAPVARAELALYPLKLRAPKSPDAFSWSLGLAGSGELIFASDTDQRGDASFTTRSDATALGLRVRAKSRHSIVLGADYVSRSFAVRGSGRPAPAVPSVDYRSLALRLGGTWLGLGTFAAEGDVAFHAVFGTGQLGSAEWFPNSSSYGVEGAARVFWRLGSVAPFVGVRWIRYVHALNPKVGDARVAGGAQDDYVLMTVGLRFGTAE